MALNTALTKLLNIEHPIMLAGMGGVSYAEVCAAMCTAGGYGVLGMAGTTPDFIEGQMKRVRELTDRPFGVDLLAASPESLEESVDVIINNGADSFVAGLGVPMPIMERLKKANVKVMVVGGAVKHAIKAEQAGCDAVILQGGEGGGMGGMGGGPMDFGKSKSKFQEVPETGVTFADVAGVEGAKLELQEVVDFLKNPDKYTALGAKIPKGCLLVGPPGTGKTLIAKAVAGEAGVPFFSCAASEFVELFVGVGASRVRDLFEKAKSKAPCIIFIDEIDAVGRQRGSGMGGGNDEREQTINQLLTEMDGFEGNTGVIVLAATNRPDVLDSALLRPGRFDRQVTVDRPDVAGRIRILKVHARGKTLAKDVDFDKIARRTPGFTGADLENLMNESAILAARRELTEISKEEIADALERIIAGAAKEGAVMSEKKKRLVAYHEAGHALVGALMPDYDAVTKISIVPRGNAGGLTFFAPSEERLESGLYSRTYLENQMAVAMGGRVAEELIFGAEDVTTGASGDFQQVTRTARMMVEQMGFSKKIGQIAIKSGGGNSFLGNDVGRGADYSAATAAVVDEEVKTLVTAAYRRAKDLVQLNIDVLHAVADVLMEKENIDGEEFERIMLGAKSELYLKADEPSVTVPYQTDSA